MSEQPDIVERARQLGGKALRVPLLMLVSEMADEIERLRAELERAMEVP